MKKNEIRFTIRNKNNELEVYSVELKNGEIYYNGLPLTCDCSENKYKYIFRDNEVVCPVCGRKSETVYTYEDYQKEQFENLHLRLIGEDESTGLKLYKLNTTLEYEEWCKVEDLFVKLDNENIRLIEYYNPIIGWVTTEPYKVEERLEHLIKPENRLSYEAKQEYKTQSYFEEKCGDLLQEINEEFIMVDPPEYKYVLDGETIQNPLNPKNMYGGGEWFVITDEYIWKVINNSSPGDDIRFNNVVTESYGAIGRRVPYTEELATKIRRLKSLTRVGDYFVNYSIS